MWPENNGKQILPRPDKDTYFLQLAHLVATRATCVRRQVGAIIVDRRGHVRATGYNGVPKGAPHCNEGHECPGAKAESGTNLDSCLATHAETNALLQVMDTGDLHSLYVTVSPCIHCVKLVANSSIKRIVVAELYPGSESVIEQLTQSKLVLIQHHGFQSGISRVNWSHPETFGYKVGRLAQIQPWEDRIDFT